MLHHSDILCLLLLIDTLIFFPIGGLNAFLTHDTYDSIAQWSQFDIQLLLLTFHVSIVSLISPTHTILILLLYSDGYWACLFCNLKATSGANRVHHDPMLRKNEYQKVARPNTQYSFVRVQLNAIIVASFKY
jgi:hypothetical protein